MKCVKRGNGIGFIGPEGEMSSDQLEEVEALLEEMFEPGAVMHYVLDSGEWRWRVCQSARRIGYKLVGHPKDTGQQRPVEYSPEDGLVLAPHANAERCVVEACALFVLAATYSGGDSMTEGELTAWGFAREIGRARVMALPSGG